MDSKSFANKYRVEVMGNGAILSDSENQSINKIITDTISIHIGEMAVAGQGPDDLSTDDLQNKIIAGLKEGGFNSIDINVIKIDEHENMGIEEFIKNIMRLASGGSDETLRQAAQEKISTIILEYMKMSHILDPYQFCAPKVFSDIGHILPYSVKYITDRMIKEKMGNKNAKEASLMLQRIFQLSLFSHMLNPHPEDLLNQYFDREQMINDFHSAVQGNGMVKINELHKEFHGLMHDIDQMEKEGVH